MKNVLLYSIFLILLTSCEEGKKDASEISKTEATEEIAANYQTIEVEIDGMTCEIGCARTIESKISKTKGVIYSKVDFESKKGIFTYDLNIISSEIITKKIEGIAGGGLYFPRNLKIYEKIVK